MGCGEPGDSLFNHGVQGVQFTNVAGEVAVTVQDSQVDVVPLQLLWSSGGQTDSRFCRLAIRIQLSIHFTAGSLTHTVQKH